MKMNCYITNLLQKLSFTAFLILFLTVGYTVNAQEEDESEEAAAEEVESKPKKENTFWKNLEWGPKAGVTFSNFYDYGSDISEYRAGFIGGVSFVYPVSNLISVGIEGLYAIQGANDVNPSLFYTEANPVRPKELDVALQTIELPVIATIDLSTEADPDVIPYLILGNSFGLNLMAEGESTWQFSDGAEKNGIDNLTEKFQAQNFGLIGGLGFEIIQKRGPAKPMLYTLEFRYRFGYSDMGNIPKDQIEQFDDFNNNYFAATFGLKF